MKNDETAITDLLDRHRRGETGALERVVPLLYEDLRRLARRQLRRGRPGDTLNTTALVHEAYLKVLGKDDGWESPPFQLPADSQVLYFQNFSAR